MVSIGILSWAALSCRFSFLFVELRLGLSGYPRFPLLRVPDWKFFFSGRLHRGDFRYIWIGLRFNSLLKRFHWLITGSSGKPFRKNLFSNGPLFTREVPEIWEDDGFFNCSIWFWNIRLRSSAALMLVWMVGNCCCRRSRILRFASNCWGSFPMFRSGSS